MIIHRRLCDRQPTGSRLCGYYAVTAAISICHGIDPTGAVYNAQTMVNSVNRVVSSSAADVVPVERQRPRVDVRVERKDKLYCLCQTPAESRDMIECSVCGNWFHFDCVQPSEAQRRGHFAGPCCQREPVPANPEDVVHVSSSHYSSE